MNKTKLDEINEKIWQEHKHKSLAQHAIDVIFSAYVKKGYNSTDCCLTTEEKTLRIWVSQKHHIYKNFEYKYILEQVETFDFFLHGGKHEQQQKELLRIRF